MKNREKLIEEILENFDFNKVKKVMDFLSWEWGFLDEPAVPSTYRIIESAKERLTDAYDKALECKRNYYSFSGGLKGSAMYENGKVVCLTLDFVLETWDTNE